MESWSKQAANDCTHSGTVLYRDPRNYIVGREKARNPISRSKVNLETMNLSRYHQRENQEGG